MCIMERRKRTWPVKFLITEPTKENPHSTSQMFYAHEWDAYQESLPPDRRDPDFADSAEATVDSPASAETSAAPADPPNATTSKVPSALASFDSSASFDSPIPSDPSLPPDFDRHSRRCAVCSHPDRDAIEGEFIRWRSPKNIVRNYKIADPSSLYRHAHATGLFTRRRREFARVLEDILEIVEDSSLETADVIIRAARLYARLDENGNWFEPTRTNIILTGPVPGQFSENPDLEISAVPANRPRKIPFKLASKLTEEKKAKKKLIATHPSSKSESNS
jgi:hypothetical protein